MEKAFIFDMDGTIVAYKGSSEKIAIPTEINGVKLTLDTEYKRDLAKGLPIKMPRNYYRNNDPEKGPLVTWRGHGNLLFQNWLNYYVYQETPYDINAIH